MVHTIQSFRIFFAEFIANCHEKNSIRRYLKHCDKKQPRVVLLGTPEHMNIGDSAITLAELRFLEKCGFFPENIKEISAIQYYRQGSYIRQLLRQTDLICLHGGGNMGNQWKWEEKLRRRILMDMLDNPKIIFPQTVYYTDDPDGRKELEASIPFYNNELLMIAARELTSYAQIINTYPSAEVLLVPDIVLSLKKDVFGTFSGKREHILLCFRNDAEIQLTEAEHSEIESMLKEMRMTYRKTDMYSYSMISKQDRRDIVYKKMQEFAASKLVITDRLHGMIFAAITETPCIVLSNYNHKISDSYKWLEYLPYIKFANNVRELKRLLPDIVQEDNCSYDNEPLNTYYQKLADAIKRYAMSK